MLSPDALPELVSSAYQHLYDFVYLRGHPLAQIVPAVNQTNVKERGWQLHKHLLEVINELDPGPNAPLYSKEWRRYRLMVLRYVDGLEPQLVADQLAISRRQYYREHAAALEAVAGILSSRYRTAFMAAGDAETLLQQEVARIVQQEQGAVLGNVIDGVVSLLDPALQERQIDVLIAVPTNLPPVVVSHSVLRQALLGVLGYLIERMNHATIHFSAQVANGDVHLSIETVPAIEGFGESRIASFQEMLTLEEATLAPIHIGAKLAGFLLMLPANWRASILVVDDNEDMLALYERYLIANHYQVICADTAQAAIELAKRAQPILVILDLMMPDQDGWEVLQVLGTETATAHIPILVCSVLKQKDLALTLGAKCFLEKPINEVDLLAAISALDDKHDFHQNRK